MIYPVYTLRDVKVGFDTQFLVQMNDDCAKRAFEMMISNTTLMTGFRPSDFELYKIAEFDTDSGQIRAVTVPEFIIGGGDYAK